MPQQIEKLHLYLCIVAALVMTVVCILKQVTLYRMSVWVSITIVLFYIIGQMLRLFITNMFFSKQEDEQDGDDAHTIDEDEDDQDHDTDNKDGRGVVPAEHEQVK